MFRRQDIDLSSSLQTHIIDGGFGRDMIPVGASTKPRTLPSFCFGLRSHFRIVLLYPLQRSIPVIFHHTLLLEVFDLKQPTASAMTHYRQTEYQRCTNPTFRAISLICDNFLRAHLSSLFIFLDCIENMVLVQALEEQISRLVTDFSRAAIRGDEAAVFRLRSSRFRL
jgi:hypothetical protein